MHPFRHSIPALVLAGLLHASPLAAQSADTGPGNLERVVRGADAAPAASAAGAAPAGTARDADAELALEAVMLAGGERGVAVVRRVLDGDYGMEVKSRALFVLTQIDAAAAEKAIEGIVSGAHPVELKRQAISMIGMGGRPGSLERLVALLPTLKEPEVREGVVEALLIAGRADLLLDVARSAPDAGLRSRAVQALGAISAVEQLAALYPTLPDVDARREVLQALGVAGAVPQLQRIAETEADPELRAHAVRALGISGGDAGRAGILSAFRAATSPELRQSAIEALMVSGATDELVTLYREAREVETRRQILRAITASDPDRALDLIDESLK
jgi:hypothetical protein